MTVETHPVGAVAVGCGYLRHDSLTHSGWLQFWVTNDGVTLAPIDATTSWGAEVPDDVGPGVVMFEWASFADVALNPDLVSILLILRAAHEGMPWLRLQTNGTVDARHLLRFCSARLVSSRPHT